MAIIFSDEEIASFIEEPKILPKDYISLFKLKQKIGHKEQELEVRGQKGNTFIIILRQNNINVLDFSVILAYRPEKSNQNFRLCRYNGKHEHTNKIEGNTFYDFHIHTATERYQSIGFKEDTYAEPTDLYADIFNALNVLVEKCNFELTEGLQKPLF